MSTTAEAWVVTRATLRAGLATVLFTLAAVLTGRLDLLVLATPFAVALVGALARTPRHAPQVRRVVSADVVREGQPVTVTVHVSVSGPPTGAEYAVAALVPNSALLSEDHGVVGGSMPRRGDGRVALALPLIAARWGHYEIGDGQVAVSSPWCGFQWGPVALPGRRLTCLPAAGPFSSRPPIPHPLGLVGVHPARRTGMGTEFAGVRPFRVGDRLRRIRWPVSLRTGELHVTTTTAEEDAGILLIVDASTEVGASEGVFGRASSLDVTVRAAAALAEHALGRGDRVGLRVLGAARRTTLPTLGGRRQLRAVLDTLASISHDQNRRSLGDRRDPARLDFRVPAGTTAIVLTTLLDRLAIDAIVALAERDIDVVIVDTLPPSLPDSRRPTARLAWTVRRLQRDEVVAALARRGLAVVRWRGPGTLDEMLVRLARRPVRPGARR